MGRRPAGVAPHREGPCFAGGKDAPNLGAAARGPRGPPHADAQPVRAGGRDSRQGGHSRVTAERGPASQHTGRAPVRAQTPQSVRVGGRLPERTHGTWRLMREPSKLVTARPELRNEPADHAWRPSHRQGDVSPGDVGNGNISVCIYNRYILTSDLCFQETEKLWAKIV